MTSGDKLLFRCGLPGLNSLMILVRPERV
jgi:hypothetical protein